MKKILCLVFILSFLSSSPICKDKKFSVAISKEESFKTILEQIAQECFLSIIFKDKISAQILDNKGMILNFYQASLEEILKTALEAFDLYYTLKDNVVSISYLETKTFFIHYISTSRVASSNTNIIFSQDVAQNNFSTNLPMSGGDNHQRVIDIANQQDDFISKSGSKIYSLDAIDFWGEIEKELKQIIFRENDRYLPQDTFNPIVINKASGFVTITASPSQIKRAQEYIRSLNKKLSTQVLIDVNILTVSHRNSKTTGIDWSSIYNLGIGGIENNPLMSFNNNALDYGINIFSQDLTIGKIIEFLNSYGDVSSVSNPKILTLNNQPALISVGNVIRYTQNLVYQTSNNTTTLQNTKQQYPSVFSGVLLDITPSIEGDYIILKINPSITATKDSKIENEADALLAPPNLSTNQLSSIVRLKNDQKVVLGGLISKLQMKQQKRVPILGYIPVVKYLFSHTRDLDQSQEMVIVITPKIVNFEEQP
ncbi:MULTISPECIES: pilus (MSHA type) biogenesis protein MshL [unclassified Helicobacter]|uniref:pilus (MSHA type) biogenesis protein MshL n=1 Tax=unclassified Helicobacter TaxID=2593540 RepID=UPI000CF08B3F|nr:MULTISPECIES: pilus (MSHA type) biogenesis protein MshL [unclassified Helicobacter]